MKNVIFLKSFFRPIGIVLFVASVGLVIADLVISSAEGVSRNFLSDCASNIVMACALAGAFMMLFSKEKAVSDEVKSRLICQAVLLFIVYQLIQILFFNDLGSLWLTVYINPIALYVLYLIVYAGYKLKLKN